MPALHSGLSEDSGLSPAVLALPSTPLPWLTHFDDVSAVWKEQRAEGPRAATHMALNPANSCAGGPGSGSVLSQVLR